jgi:archaellum component FlaC
MGRPKRNGDNSDTPQVEYKKITVRPTPEQLDELNARAASFGYKSLSKYLIERGLKEGEMIVSTDRERIERLLFEVRRVGVNINQIAREMHRGYSEYSQAYLDRAMQQVERVVKEIAEEVKA